MGQGVEYWNVFFENFWNNFYREITVQCWYIYSLLNVAIFILLFFFWKFSFSISGICEECTWGWNPGLLWERVSHYLSSSQDYQVQSERVSVSMREIPVKKLGNNSQRWWWVWHTYLYSRTIFHLQTIVHVLLSSMLLCYLSERWNL